MASFHTSRKIPATAEKVFSAFSDSKRLERWWGPAGFTNAFNVCEFRKGGSWVYVMHGPDGRTYINESVFAAIEPSRKIVIQHVSEPKYLLTILLDPFPGGTLVSWSQVFENPNMTRLQHILVPANEQNLDRLSAEVLRTSI